MNANLLEPADFFLLRVPTSPISGLKVINRIQDIKFLQEAILEFFEESFYNEALFIASPILHSRLISYKKNSNLFSKKDQDKLYVSLYKYLIRAHSRSTPFGLFAGFSMGRIMDLSSSNIILEDKSRHQKKIRLDSGLIFELSRTLSERKSIKMNISFYANTTIYKINGTYRYAEWVIENEIKKYILSSVQVTSYLSDIIEASKGGCMIADLVDLLVGTHEAPEDEAFDYINELISSQILLSSLTPNVSGEPYLNRLKVTIGSIENEDAKQINQLLCDLSVHTDVTHLEFLMGYINFEWKDKPGFQTDLKLDAKINVIGRAGVMNIVTIIGELGPFITEKTQKSIEDFKRKFKKKYGSSEVSLCEALDPEHGIGFEAFGNLSAYSALTDDILIDFESVDDAESTFNWDKIQTFLFNKYVNAIKKNEKVINLSEEDLEDLKCPCPDLAESSYIFGNFFKDENQELKFNLKLIDGPSSSKLIGRFCAHDDELFSSVREVLLDEAKCQDDAIYAEIIYVPQNRLGNVLIRPHLRPYEIPFVGQSTLPDINQFPVEDILVCIKDNKIILKSKRLNKKIVPRESSAYYASKNDLPIYIFLSSLYVQDYPHSIMFNWKLPFSDQPFLPRIEYKNIVLSPATWNLSSRYIRKLLKGQVDNEENQVRLIKDFYGLPEVCVLRIDENEQLLDLNNYYSRLLLLEFIDKNDYVILEEDFFYNAADSLVKDTSGERFNHEVIIPLKHKYPYKSSVENDILKSKSIKNRYHLPGDIYLYYNIFIAPRKSNDFLIEFVLPLLHLCEGFFFIRYDLPSHHLRLRFINRKETADLLQIITKLNPKMSELRNDNEIYDCQISTYEQELSVYSEEFINESEAFFCIDSLFVLKYFQQRIESSEIYDDDYDLLVAVKGIEDILEMFHMTLGEKIDFMDSLSREYYLEFGGTRDLKLQLSRKYTYYKNSLIMLSSDCEQLLDSNTLKLLNTRIHAAEHIFAKIREMKEEHNDILIRLKERFIHLFMNRMFRFDSRKTELLIYYIMYKSYLAQRGISKVKNING